LRDVVVAALLVLGVALQLLSCAGLLAMRSTFARLHYVAPAGFGVAAVAAAIFVEESFSVIGDKALATAALLLLTGPVLVHVTGRAARVHGRGDWRVGDDEDVERVEA
jgi:multicomponent Na+:H+ antiporter subunit G